ncbi:MAG: group II intron reverse transcriptase domain-containing protein [Candidatus Aenigmarchaeota archaeon]|nr:group II intron reverse transcriptase domain-containing protein [Candidatus Aenigmarchaeota archaeon]
MKTYKNLWTTLCSFDNLFSAYEKAKHHKSTNTVVQKFEEHWRLHLCTLLKELRTKTYKPKPLETFVLRDPKTRTICVSNFRDRVVHHALVNVLQSIFEPKFIYDSYASRKDKGTSAALQRLDSFICKVTTNGKKVPETSNANDVCAFALKADIQHYFDTVDHNCLLNIMSRYIKDKDVIWLVQTILNHYNSGTPRKGMPLGNWTSQFFANIYLNELDQFVKHTLKSKYYIRYVDDFVILHRHKSVLQEYEFKIKEFLAALKLELHPTKCKIIPLRCGISWLGFRVFYHHKLPRQRNVRKIWNRIKQLLDEYEEGKTAAVDVFETLQGWKGYAIMGNTYNCRAKLRMMTEAELQRRTELRKLEL